MDVFNVYDHLTVIFGAYTSATTPYTTKTEYQQAIQVKAQNESIAINPIINSCAFRLYGGNGTVTLFSGQI